MFSFHDVADGGRISGRFFLGGGFVLQLVSI